MPRRPTDSLRRRCSMARRRASMREGPLAELFRATEAAQRQAEKEGRTEEEAPPETPVAPAQASPTQPSPTQASPAEPPEQTVEHVPEWVEEAKPKPEPVRLPERKPEPEKGPKPEPALPPVAARAEPKPARDRPKLEPLPEPPPRLHRV